MPHRGAPRYPIIDHIAFKRHEGETACSLPDLKQFIVELPERCGSLTASHVRGVECEPHARVFLEDQMFFHEKIADRIETGIIQPVYRKRNTIRLAIIVW